MVSGHDDGVILNPGDFYIQASKEPITVPPDHAAEMVAYDTLVGEFRVHYAGFFDPGFGHAESGRAGSPRRHPVGAPLGAIAARRRRRRSANRA